MKITISITQTLAVLAINITLVLVLFNETGSTCNKKLIATLESDFGLFYVIYTLLTVLFL